MSLTSDDVIRLMEDHEGEWDEIAFDGWGDEAIARWDRYTHHSGRFGFQGIAWDTPEDAHAALIEWVDAHEDRTLTTC